MTSQDAIEFTSDMRCNHNDIDAEHFAIIQSIQNINSALVFRRERLIIANSFRSLYGKAASHFYNEERIMSSIGYFGIFEQRIAHRYLLEQISVLKEWHENNEIRSKFGGIIPLYKLLANHFVTMDKDIGIFISKYQNRFSA